MSPPSLHLLHTSPSTTTMSDPTGNEGSPNPSNAGPGNNLHRPLAIRFRPIRPRPAHMAPPPTPTNPPPPPMGVPGVSAFRPFVRRPPPPLQSRGPSSSSGQYAGGSSSGIGRLVRAPFGGYFAIPVDGSEGGGEGPRIRIGPRPRNKVWPTLSIRRRRPEAPPPPPPPPPPADGEERPVPFVCTVCGRDFGTAKALFGHMRSHPERGWRGAMPPPVFNAAEELAALNPVVLNSGPGVGQAPVPGGGGEEPAAPQDEGGADQVAAPQEEQQEAAVAPDEGGEVAAPLEQQEAAAAQAGDQEVAAPEEEHGGDEEAAAAAPQEEEVGAAEEGNEEEAVEYRVPDLNKPPPPEN